MKIQKTLNSHNNLKEKWSWRDQASYTAKVQWLKQNSMVQVQKQTYRLMEQNRKPRRNKKKRNPDIWSINYDKGGKNIQ